MEHLEIYNKIRIVPEEAKKKITGGRIGGMTDINPMWRIKTLTENFGICGIGWKYVITSQRLEKGCNEEISAFVTIDLFIKVNDVWSDGIPGVGGSSFVAKEKNGMYQSDECFKMALTDAISVACKAIGMGADVYFEKDRTKYDAKSELDNKVENKKPSFLDVNKAIDEMDNARSRSEMDVIWKKYVGLQSDEHFRESAKKTGLKYPKTEQNGTNVSK